MPAAAQTLFAVHTEEHYDALDSLTYYDAMMAVVPFESKRFWLLLVFAALRFGHLPFLAFQLCKML
jgi:hypothetical protein